MTAGRSEPFDETERAAVYRVIAERRDMRHFVGGEVDPAVLRRLLEAANMAPSVGLMVPVSAAVAVSSGALPASRNTAETPMVEFHGGSARLPTQRLPRSATAGSAGGRASMVTDPEAVGI